MAEHLHPSVRHLIDLPPEERIRRIQMDRWIGYTRAEAALAALEELLAFPTRSRMPNMILVGATNNGKSMIVEKFCQDHRALSEDSPLHIPVLKLQMPSAGDEKGLCAAVLRVLGMSVPLTERVLPKISTAMTLMEKAKVQLILIDEFHNMLAATRAQQHRLLNFVRWLGNECRIPIVAAGTIEALRAIQSDEQLANRFMPFVLPLWQSGPDYVKLLNTLESVLPLREPSQLAHLPLAQRIMTAAEGVLGEIVAVVTRAATRAIASGEERIDTALLDRLDFIPPSQRRHAAERSLSS